MNASRAKRRWPVRAAGWVAVALFLALVARFWHPVYGFTSFLQLDASNDDLKIAAFREMPVYVYRNTGGYDGLYYAQIAYHPALDAPELRPAIDSLAYRARRILPSLLAWIIAGGNPAWIVHVYSLLNVAAWLALAALLWRLLAVDSARAWLAWAGVMFSAGALCSVRFALTDLVALAILAGALLAAERGREGWATGALALSGLARETSLAALPGFWERPWLSARNARRTLVAILPLAAWFFYVRWRAGENGSGLGNFAWPVVGYVEKWRAGIAGLRGAGDALPLWTTLLATLGLGVQALFFFTRWQPGERWWRIGAVYAVFMLWLGTAVWEGLPGAATRVLLPLSLAFNILAHRGRAPLVWLIAGNLTVAAGLVAITGVHYDPNELAAARAHGTAAVATLGDGWYGRERTSHHSWTWCSGRGTVAFETWPKTSAAVRLEFNVRSLAPCTVTVREDGRELWRGAVGVQRGGAQGVPVTLSGGRATLEFSTDLPATRGGANGDPRALAFALYDVRLVVPEP